MSLINATVATSPESEQHNSWLAFWKVLTFFDQSKLAPLVAFRNSAGMLISLYLGVVAHVDFGIAAAGCGALFVSYSDSNDPYRHRAVRMVAASVMLASAGFVGGLSAHNHIAAILVAAAASFVAGMFVVFGRTVADVGVMSLVMLAVFAGQQLTFRSLFESALLALAGGLLQAALSLIFWPVRRYEPERRALAALYIELGRIAAQRITSDDAPPATSHASQAQESLRNLHEDSTANSERYVSLLNQAERARLSIIALQQMRTTLPANSHHMEVLRQYLQISGQGFAAIGRSLLDGSVNVSQHQQIARLDDFIEEWSTRAQPSAPSAEVASWKYMLSKMDALAGQLRAAERLAAGGIAAGGSSVRPSVKQADSYRPDSVLSTLRANLNFKSTVFRHAIRLMLCFTIAEIIARATDWRRSYWIPMTVVLLLRPDFAGTFTRGLQRMAGTVMGLLLATVALLFLPPTIAIQALLIGLFVFLLRWLGPANYSFFAMGVTAAIVVMLASTGIASKTLIVARAINSFTGGIIALATYALWPTPEPIGNALADLMAAYRDYFVAVLHFHSGSQSSAMFADRQRLAARRARSNLEASLDRLATEPDADAKTIGAVRSMMASSHRFVYAIMVLDSAGPYPTEPQESPNLRKFAEDIQTTLLGLERLLRGQSLSSAGLPDLRDDFQLLLQSSDPASRSILAIAGDTLVNTLNTLREQVFHWRELRPSRTS